MTTGFLHPRLLDDVMAALETLFLHSTSNAPRLRVLAVTDGTHLSRPDATALHQILRSDFATLAAVVIGRAAAPSDGAERQHVLFRIAEAWDRRLYPDVHAQLAHVDASGLLAQVPHFPASIDPSDRQIKLPAATVRQLQGLSPDVVLDCTTGPVSQELLGMARYGVWSIHLGRADEPRSACPYIWEIHESRLVSTAALLLHGEVPGQTWVMAQASVATEHSLFRGKNCLRPMLASLTFVIRKLQELHQGGWEAIQRSLAPVRPLPQGRVRPRQTPSNRAMLKFLAPRILCRAANLVRRPALTFRWRIAIRLGSQHKLIDSTDPASLSAFRWAAPPRGVYYADPFLLKRNGRLWLFCEELSLSEGKGVLICMEVLPNGNLSEPTRILHRPYHLSYPALIEDGSEVFMIPEAAGSGRVELYHATEFPYRWKKVRDLLPIRAVDTTPWFKDGRFWLLATAVDSAESGYQLILFHSERLDGEWTLHPASPISMDAHDARCAGAIVHHGGRMYRPSQDCVPYYGHKLGFHEIVRLDLQSYEERLVHQVEPRAWPNLRGVHTYATCDDVEIIDGQS